MTRKAEQRTNPRLKLHYPIRVNSDGADDATVLGRTVTQDVGARGAYFFALHAESYRIGQEVAVVLSVPHRLSSGGGDVVLDLSGRGRVVRLEAPESHRTFGEDGLTLTGVAVEFSGSLTFQYRWI